ncbi:MAG: hypothetical protein N0C90_21665, partial [Candidatus Thiodiazotropha endolucinida]|nr:hypothetical protein [Candidatus Thiodiazotropha taylori]MCW4263964.1 hypothetical protein [Candidatus Thiodiazotropha endolucinida]
VCQKQHIGGRWSSNELGHHINYLELLAMYHGIKSFCKDMSNKAHIQIRTDNKCAMSYINSMGGNKSHDCNDLARQIWLWCIDRNFWISASFIPGSENPADHDSRHYNDNVEWKLDPYILGIIFSKWNTPDIDMFASRLNRQLKRYASWKPDPEAEIIDAFTCSWSDLYMYVFPPFSLISRLVAKLKQDQGECILIAPVWTSQTWFPSVMGMITDTPYLLPKDENLLTIPGTTKCHPLRKKMNLMACLLSGDQSKVEMFLQKQPVSSWRRGDPEHKNSTRPTSRDGFATVVKGKLINFKRIQV